MRLSHTYQPTTLDEVVGQPGIIRRLKAVVAHPSPCCILLEGRGGVGKSAAAAALIRGLGVSEFGVQSLAGAKLRIELVEQLFYQTFRYRPMAGAPWHILLIEEMELLPSKNVNSELKDQLSEQNHPERLIVIATSNDASGLDEALLQRFDIYPFSCGPSFADACADRLNEIWEMETGSNAPMPPEVALMGWRNNSYSMRRALSALGAAVEMHRASRAKEVAVC
jgi:replication-associated recombination protein RarA